MSKFYFVRSNAAINLSVSLNGTVMGDVSSLTNPSSSSDIAFQAGNLVQTNDNELPYSLFLPKQLVTGHAALDFTRLMTTANDFASYIAGIQVALENEPESYLEMLVGGIEEGDKEFVALFLGLARVSMDPETVTQAVDLVANADFLIGDVFTEAGIEQIDYNLRQALRHAATVLGHTLPDSEEALTKALPEFLQRFRASEPDPLARFPKPMKGYERCWVACNECGKVAYYDFIPYALSQPILNLSCGHQNGQRLMDAATEVTEEQARAFYAENYIVQKISHV